MQEEFEPKRTFPDIRMWKSDPLSSEVTVDARRAGLHPYNREFLVSSVAWRDMRKDEVPNYELFTRSQPSCCVNYPDYRSLNEEVVYKPYFVSYEV